MQQTGHNSESPQHMFLNLWEQSLQGKTPKKTTEYDFFCLVKFLFKGESCGCTVGRVENRKNEN